MNNLNITGLIKQLVFVGLATYFLSGILEISQMIIFPILALLYFTSQAVEMYKHISEDWSEQVEQEKKINASQATELQMAGKELAELKQAQSDRVAGYKADLANFEQVINTQKRHISELETELSNAKADKKQLGDARLYQELEAIVENSAMPSANKTFKWLKIAVEKSVERSITASANGAGGRAQ